ncbi:hypothetical protein PO878_05440 [Iamia majanohamensis]|uniref:DUF1440 domain-containing protein n=1 Tax=Iamia majanohamensis TaxID=467976 RepID=A0AAF0BUU5_9ACTN|nr:hypothetical protein [Iamia majanohamensis]WCO68167.1 hypothetical protein PO878_05440 [Iamia majanohamensis]
MSSAPGPGLAGRVVRGVVAGAVGTLAMDLVWWGRYRRGGGEDGFVDWDLATSTAGFDEASAPGQVGRRVAGAVGVELPDAAAATTTNVVHWATGAQWGALYGLAAGRGGRPSPALGLLLGPTAWGSAYVLLGAAGIYEPIWTYDRETLARDLSAHLVFGLATAATYRLLDRS